ncbi:phasin family protein [Actibacterium sp. XHP0104]|uniref:phasin family protein n=1 Tax=Actibacterium sp. XHP0104 TaxID=2984335 RepID=UPI0021E984FE|nr:phasin family protein [Actibacterium sp. XHP0104]MCV2882424.1 phasin family protein [Actibacterium sp. XHP0104]
MAKSAKKPEAADNSMSAMTAAMMAGNPLLAKAWTDMMEESARFLSERLKEDMDTQAAFMACKSPVEMAQVQSEFFRKAMEDYTAEAQRMFALMTEATEQALKQSGTGVKRKYDDVPI